MFRISLKMTTENVLLNDYLIEKLPGQTAQVSQEKQHQLKPQAKQHQLKPREKPREEPVIVDRLSRDELLIMLKQLQSGVPAQAVAAAEKEKEKEKEKDEEEAKKEKEEEEEKEEKV